MAFFLFLCFVDEFFVCVVEVVFVFGFVEVMFD